MTIPIQFYGFWRSLASYRVRVALKLKGLAYEEISVNLLAGHQHDPTYLKINPQGAVPALIVEGMSQPLVQSLAILDYLDHAHPQQPLLPQAPADRARVLALAHLCASDSHPLVVPRVRNYLQNTLQLNEAARTQWLQHWSIQALQSYERTLVQDPREGCYSHGDCVSLADLCLASQVVGAELFGCKLENLPRVTAVYQALMTQAAFAESLPLRQAGAPQPNT